MFILMDNKIKRLLVQVWKLDNEKNGARRHGIALSIWNNAQVWTGPLVVQSLHKRFLSETHKFCLYVHREHLQDFSIINHWHKNHKKKFINKKI